jgi:hypothetical protein
MSAIAGYNGAVLITSPPSVNLAANIALQDSGDHTTFFMSAGNAAYRYWDNANTITFQTSPDGSTSWGTVVPASIQYPGGRVTFPAAVTGATPSARISVGKYFVYTLLANVTEWDFDGEWILEDATALSGAIGGGGGSRAMVYVPTMQKGTFKLKKWWVDELSMSNLNYITTAVPLILSCVAPTGGRFEGHVWDNKMSIKNAVEKLITEDLDFQITGNFYAF